MYSITLDPVKILHTDRHSTWHYRCHSIPAEIVGVEVEVHARKRGRVEDHQIQLQLRDEPVGDNRAAGASGDVHRYGSPSDTWGMLLKFEDVNHLSVLTQYLCAREPASSVLVEQVRMIIHYRPFAK